MVSGVWAQRILTGVRMVATGAIPRSAASPFSPCRHSYVSALRIRAKGSWCPPSTLEMQKDWGKNAFVFHGAPPSHSFRLSPHPDLHQPRHLAPTLPYSSRTHYSAPWQNTISPHPSHHYHHHLTHNPPTFSTTLLHYASILAPNSPLTTHTPLPPLLPPHTPRGG